ncbi:flagellar biosynthesis protein FlhF [Aerosticca soli]|uniref:Flagellar biosynthesis protein FlhF n=1 Tax=Aerosticca soli TaxID=2010829 RepID=A0A2Z6E3Q2_9GAMM|nr:flagellar biosynthesis protein FlhF [Aerosticca soli]MDI3262767.1 flagellar biosynthesis protein FlhF [Fulvimonas sp.]BBD79391.1 flagellar biosynthesis protein FlhF [Aerosticca soli]
MKIKRFVAPDMRQAMRLVREEQGPDAVILSTRRLDEGIEVIAAVDYDEALVREAASQGVPLPAVAPAEPAPEPTRAAARPLPRDPSAAGREETAAARMDRPAAPVAASTAGAAPGRHDTASRRAAQPAGVDMPSPAVGAPSLARRDAAAARPDTPAPARGTAGRRETDADTAGHAAPGVHPLLERTAADTRHLRVELDDLRDMLEMQLSSLVWNDMERRQPLRARILRELTRLGVDADVARRLADGLPAELNPEQARYLPLGLLGRALRVGARELAGAPGMLALVGPTGVGKTTTVAKLAAHAARRHGPGQVALVSTDHYRIGGAAQLEHYGRLLGVRVYPADDAASLRQVLRMLEGKHTVLVDTAGVAGCDPRLEQQMDVLNEVAHSGEVSLRACLVLAANAQAQALDEAVRAYLPLAPGACILTKLDEAPCLGGALSVLIRHQLALDYTADGQRVPEDIAVADARTLVCRAAKGTRQQPPVDDELMAERFGLAMA